MKRSRKILAGCLAGTGAALAGVSLQFARQAKKMDDPPIPVPDQGKIRIACIGDSITYGAGVMFYGREKKVWTAKLGELLGGEYQVLNYGISGATLQDEGDKPYKTFKQLDKAKEAQPAVCILMLGTNDSKPYNWDADRYKEQLALWIEDLKGACPDCKIVLITPPYTCPARGKKVVAFDILNETIRDEIRPIVMEAAAANGLPLIDLYTCTDGRSDWLADGVHPNAEGNKQIAAYICRELEAQHVI